MLLHLFRRGIRAPHGSHGALSGVWGHPAPSRPASQPRCYASPTASSPLHVCVIGAGPAGMYATDKLLRRYGDQVRVDVLDRLPTPFGLVRSGVAADHQDTKSVVHSFQKTMSDPRCSFYGHVHFGKDVKLTDLQSHYHVVLLAYGCEDVTMMGVEGEDRARVCPARDFVWWLNGHPDQVRFLIVFCGPEDRKSVV